MGNANPARQPHPTSYLNPLSDKTNINKPSPPEIRLKDETEEDDAPGLDHVGEAKFVPHVPGVGGELGQHGRHHERPLAAGGGQEVDEHVVDEDGADDHQEDGGDGGDVEGGEGVPDLALEQVQVVGELGDEGGDLVSDGRHGGWLVWLRS